MTPTPIRTPLIRSPWLADATGADVWLKLEFLQPTGSFKIRGAWRALTALRDRDPHAHVVTTASAGNHGLALATAAAALDFTARIHVPRTAPAAKRDAIARTGAVLIEADSYDDAEARAHEEAASGATTYISPYNHPDVIDGAGAVGAEMLDDQPSLDLVVVPVGGGGLISGIALAARERAPKTEILGAEAAASPVFTAALAAGRPVTVDVHDTLADGLAGNMEPESVTFGYVRDLVSRVVRVDEPAIARAMRDLIHRERLIVEGASAVAIGGLLGLGDAVRGRRVGVVLTGRNVDPAVIARVLGDAPAGADAP